MQSQNKFHQLDLKILQIHTSVQSLKIHVQKCVKNEEDIKNILIMLTDLQGKLQNCITDINHIQTRYQDFKQNNYKTLNTLNQTISNNNKLFQKFNQFIESINQQITLLKVHMAQNDGQTNQCYIAIQKLEHKMNQLHPVKPVGSDNMNIQKQEVQNDNNTQQIIQKYFKKIMAWFLVFITFTFLCYIGRRYWNDFIDFQLKKHIITQQQNSQNTINNKEGK